MIKILQLNESKELIDKILKRALLFDENIEKAVKGIIEEVSKNGDQAVRNFTEKFDQVLMDRFEVTEDEIAEAFKNTSAELVESLTKAKENIEAYHIKQKLESYELKTDETFLQQKVMPLNCVGVYVPGGKASYPSTVLMNCIPAKIAGVNEVVIVTPPNKSGKIKDSIIVAAKLCGVNKIYKVGGAQAVAAITFGTETFPKVDKIVGPGNIFVAMAKKQVSGIVGIDMIAGPTEIVILADETANPKFIAADLLAQAEHDEMASSILITTSTTVAEQVAIEVEMLTLTMPRKDIIEPSLKNYGAIIVTEKITKAIDLVNELAPEHVEVMTIKPFEVVEKIINAGGVFIGDYTPESVGDYYGGTNHTLPTSGTARFSSPLSVTDFQKKMSIVYYSKKALKEAKEHIERIAEEEELFAHGYAATVRFEGDK
jgi:histidinol dehydrogenase